MLERVGNLTWHHPRKVLAAAFLFAAVAAFFGHDVEHHLKAAGFTDPSSESERAERHARRARSASPREPGLVVLRAGPRRRAAVEPRATREVARLADELRGATYVGNVTADPAPRTASPSCWPHS